MSPAWRSILWLHSLLATLPANTTCAAFHTHSLVFPVSTPQHLEVSVHLCVSLFSVCLLSLECKPHEHRHHLHSSSWKGAWHAGSLKSDRSTMCHPFCTPSSLPCVYACSSIDHIVSSLEQLFPEEVIRGKGGAIKIWEWQVDEEGIYGYKMLIQVL